MCQRSEGVKVQNTLMCALEHGIGWDDEYLSNTLSYKCPMIMQCDVKNMQDFKIIKITQRHSYKLIDHTSFTVKNLDERIQYPGPWWLEKINCHFSKGKSLNISNSK